MDNTSCSGPYSQERNVPANGGRMTGQNVQNVTRSEQVSVSWPERNTGRAVVDCSTNVQGYPGGSSATTPSAQADIMYRKKPLPVRNVKSGDDSLVINGEYHTRSGRAVKRPVRYGCSE